jgi:chemotaxis protein MotA
MSAPTRVTGARSTIAGLVIACAIVIGGQLLEGGRPAAILQPAAALIVIGGTLAALLVQFPLSSLRATAAALESLFRGHAGPSDASAALLAGRLVALARQARRDGRLTLERELAAVDDALLLAGLRGVVDNVPAERLRGRLDAAAAIDEERAAEPSRVLEAAGGYAPSLGVLGAVLGLIRVMEHLDDPTRLGSGVAVAFVATVYGVAFANLVLLPLAGKLRQRAAARRLEIDLIVEGCVAIAADEAPRAVEEKLAGIVPTELAA